MAARNCTTDKLVQRVRVFVTDFIRTTCEFLTPKHVAECRTFQNEVENNYQPCQRVVAPWKDDKSEEGEKEETNLTDNRRESPFTRNTPQLKSLISLRQP